MSNKAVQKLLKLREKEQKKNEGNAEEENLDEEDAGDFITKKPKSKNLFSLLNDEEVSAMTTKPKSSKKKKNKKQQQQQQQQQPSEEETKAEEEVDLGVSDEEETFKGKGKGKATVATTATATATATTAVDVAVKDDIANYDVDDVASGNEAEAAEEEEEAEAEAENEPSSSKQQKAKPNKETKQQPQQREAKKSKPASKKSKKKKAGKADIEQGEPVPDKDLLFLEKELQKMGKLKPASASTVEDDGVEALPETNTNARTTALAIRDPSKLNPDNELKKLFGARVLMSTAAETAAGNQRGMPRHQAASQQQRIRKTKNFQLVTPKDTWPPYTPTGLTMKLEKISQEEGLEYYTYEFDRDYETLEHHYALCVASHDPNHFVDMVARYPYHVASLLQLTEIYKMQGDHEHANDLLDRALMALEINWHRNFSAAALAGKARLNSRRRPNKVFFNTILMRIHSLARGGLHSTSIELCKLLLSLDPDNDPARLLLLIDFFAIMAHQSEWLLDFMEHYVEPVNESLLSLPNLMFSKAIALFKLDKIEQANDQLEEALLHWPLTVSELVNSCKLANVRQWEPVLRNTLFTHTVIQSTAFNHLIKAYVTRNIDIWNNVEMLAWLQRGVKQVLKRVADEPSLEDEYAEKRRELCTYPAFCPYQNVTGAELTGQISPPSFAVDSDELVVSTINNSNNAGNNGNGTREEMNPLLLFLSNILPWNATAPPPQ